VHLGVSLGERELCLPPDVRMTVRGEDWFRFQCDAPRQQIPLVVQCLVEHGLPVLELYEVPRSLERVYLQAVNAPDNGSNGASVMEEQGTHAR